MKQLLAYCLSIILCVSFTGCMENYLDLYPEDKITSASFPENESDIKQYFLIVLISRIKQALITME